MAHPAFDNMVHISAREGKAMSRSDMRDVLDLPLPSGAFDLAGSIGCSILDPVSAQLMHRIREPYNRLVRRICSERDLRFVAMTADGAKPDGMSMARAGYGSMREMKEPVVHFKGPAGGTQMPSLTQFAWGKAKELLAALPGEDKVQQRIDANRAAIKGHKTRGFGEAMIDSGLKKGEAVIDLPATVRHLAGASQARLHDTAKIAEFLLTATPEERAKVFAAVGKRLAKEQLAKLSADGIARGLGTMAKSSLSAASPEKMKALGATEVEKVELLLTDRLIGLSGSMALSAGVSLGAQLCFIPTLRVLLYATSGVLKAGAAGCLMKAMVDLDKARDDPELSVVFDEIQRAVDARPPQTNGAIQGTLAFMRAAEQHVMKPPTVKQGVVKPGFFAGVQQSFASRKPAEASHYQRHGSLIGSPFE